MLESKIEFFKSNGFVNLGPFDDLNNSVDQLSHLSNEIYKKKSVDPKYIVSEQEGGAGLRGLPELDPNISLYLEKIITNPQIKHFLEQALGKNYKIWQIDFRKSGPGDSGLVLHQDGPGQLNLAIILSDSNEKDGNTLFLPGSHLISRSINDLKLKLPPNLINKLPFLFKPLIGKKGDIAFFLNRTWHGRFPNHSTIDKDVILAGFFPEGATISHFDPYINWSKEYLKSIESLELFTLLNPELGTKLKSDGTREIISNGSTRNPSFSMSLENPSREAKCHLGLPLRLSLTFLSFVMIIRGIFARLYRAFKLIGR